ncbi:MAG: YggS family pyridoxal phosphate-dependent enzyme [Rhodocyclaceae bacterium]|jgi:pyridoxal phosphate enzyme (YggS family)|nr:YggS family pyridoxal phosphate-dependent enzyme [Rhodocyclaceae bacterium]MCL4757762.1 YggS family pyridoxal phosphate-dependent enzyme [Rhodocyclaceae bacterium]
MTSIQSNLQAVRRRLAAAAAAAGRDPAGIVLLAVSKTWPAASIREAVAAGQHAYGENYVQEAVHKIAELQDCALEWHFIGPLQSNKTRLAALNFDWVHSVDRLRIAERLSEQRPGSRAPLNVCIQVNVSGEQSKSGVAPGEVAELAARVRELPRLRLRGLMAIPEPSRDASVLRARFAVLRAVRDELNASGMGMDTLSMGMSDDLELAIAEGSTMIRVGSAIFGNRVRAGGAA